MRERQTVLQDWQVGSDRLSHIMRTKLGFWRELPHALVGLGYWDAREVRSITQRSLELWSRVRDVSLQHPLSILVLSEGSLLRVQLTLVASGTPIAKCPHLHKLAARLKFIPITERTIEGRHRITHQSYLHAPHAHVANLSNRSRAPELKALLESGAMNIFQLANLCDKVRGAAHNIIIK